MSQQPELTSPQRAMSPAAKPEPKPVSSPPTQDFAGQSHAAADSALAGALRAICAFNAADVHWLCDLDCAVVGKIAMVSSRSRYLWTIIL